ncbi:hypothetical protein MHY20_09700 [Helcobacillus sp. ACRRO]|uniref:hypothetical protein n=1 Tax=Helcobacillus sp. ACRRO TaxID=2918202 RepID=UPI001EF5D593|nr:hypothetical protein [Helcobacillus sp. ACRRO]MCG7427875.1 hypothetical protein [Helcobacillus sp. ACRRO]
MPAPLTARLSTFATRVRAVALAVLLTTALAGCDDLTFGSPDAPASPPSAASPGSGGGSDGGGADGSPASAEPVRPASSMDLTDEQKAQVPSAETIMNSTLDVPGACAAWTNAPEGDLSAASMKFAGNEPVSMAFTDGYSKPMSSGRTVYVDPEVVQPILFEGEPAVLVQLSCRSSGHDAAVTLAVYSADLTYIGEANRLSSEFYDTVRRAAGEDTVHELSYAENISIDGSTLSFTIPHAYGYADYEMCESAEERCDKVHELKVSYTLKKGEFALEGAEDVSPNAPSGTYGIWTEDKVRNATLPVGAECGSFGYYYQADQDGKAPKPERTAWGEKYYELTFVDGEAKNPDPDQHVGGAMVSVDKVHRVEKDGKGYILAELSCTAGGTGYWRSISVFSADGEFLGSAGSTDGPNYQAAIEKDPQVDYAEMRGSEVTSFDGSVITIHAVDIRTVKDPSDAPHAYMGTGTADIELTITPGKGLVITGLTVEAPDPEDSDANG